MNAKLLLKVQDGFKSRYFEKVVDILAIPPVGTILTIIHPNPSGGEKCTCSYGAKTEAAILSPSDDNATYDQLSIHLEPLPAEVDIRIIEQDSSWKEVTTGSQTEE